MINKPPSSINERMMPDGAPLGQFWEHIYRYRFATQFVKHMKVLDIACGEGYGTYALLKAGAAAVTGIDLCREVIHHASTKYGKYYIAGDAEKIPLANSSHDVVVSFETIEHLQNPENFVAECARVLGPRGILIISTPNKDVSKGDNEFHRREFTQAEIISLLELVFHKIRVFTQVPIFTSRWSLRAFSAIQSPWRNTRGFWRTREAIRKLVCPHIRYSVAELYRESPTEAICRDFKRASSWCNPYVVRKTSSLKGDKPRFFILIGEVKK